MPEPTASRLAAERRLAADRRARQSIHAPLEEGRARIDFDPLPITQLGPETPQVWIWEGYVGAGISTLFMALWKAGKTTLIAHLLRDLQRGGGLAGSPSEIKVLVVSEESRNLWVKRRDALKLGDWVHVLCRPFLARPTAEEWQSLTTKIADLVRRGEYGLVIYDTLASLWPVDNENDASQVTAAVMPLYAITEAGAGLVLVHHPSKGDASEGRASRGSGALPSAVDVIVELRRYAPEVPEDRRRVLRTFSRFDETPAERVLELRDDGYVVLGDKADANRISRDETILRLLPTAPPGLTAERVLAAWPRTPAPGKRGVETALAEGANAGHWQRAGRGVKGDPATYWQAAAIDSRTPTHSGPGNESAAPPPAKEAA